MDTEETAKSADFSLPDDRSPLLRQTSFDEPLLSISDPFGRQSLLDELLSAGMKNCMMSTFFQNIFKMQLLGGRRNSRRRTGFDKVLSFLQSVLTLGAMLLGCLIAGPFANLIGRQ